MAHELSGQGKAADVEVLRASSVFLKIILAGPSVNGVKNES